MTNYEKHQQYLRQAEDLQEYSRDPDIHWQMKGVFALQSQAATALSTLYLTKLRGH